MRANAANIFEAIGWGAATFLLLGLAMGQIMPGPSLRWVGPATEGNVVVAGGNDGLAVKDGGVNLATLSATAESALQRSGDRYIVVEQGLASDAARGAALKAAYATAKTMSPVQASQVTVLIPPGRYDVGTDGLTLDTAWVNIAGLVEAKVAAAGTADMVLEPTVYIYGAGQGVVKQTANNVLIRDLELRSTGAFGESGPLFDQNDPAAYSPNSNVTGTVLRRVRLSADPGWPTRLNVDFKQTFDTCLVDGEFSLGGNGGPGPRAFSGVIAHCRIDGTGCVGGEGGTMSGAISGSTIIGGYSVGSCGTVSGTIVGSTISGPNGVGGDGGTIKSTARIEDVTVDGYGAMGASTVESGAVFRDVRGVPATLPERGGTYENCVLTDGTIYSSPVVAVGNATVDGHALNRGTADGRYIPLIGSPVAGDIVSQTADGKLAPAGIAAARLTRRMLAGCRGFNGAVSLGAATGWGYVGVVAPNDNSEIAYQPVPPLKPTGNYTMTVYWAAHTNDVGKTITLYHTAYQMTTGSIVTVSYPTIQTQVVASGTAQGSWIAQPSYTRSIQKVENPLKLQMVVGSRSTDEQTANLLITAVIVDEE